MSEFRRRTLKGIVWSVGAQIVRQGLQFIVSVILARLLTPEDFGLVGMIAVFTGFAILFSDLGFAASLIQHQYIEERHYSSVFWLNIFMGLSLMIGIMFLAPLIAIFYDDTRLTSLTMLIAVNFFVGALSTVHNSILQRTMNFRLLGLTEIVSVTIAGLIAIGLAVSGYGVWSLVWQMLAASSIKAIVMWQMVNWYPKLLFSQTAITELMKFSSNLLGFKVFNYWIRNGDNLLIGKFIGSVGLGIYTRAYSLMLLPITQVSSVLGRVMFPALSTVQDDRIRVKRVYLRSISMIGLLTFPMMAGLFVVADHFVLALYGPKWIDVIPLLQIFSVLGMYQSIGVTVGWIYQSQGRTDLMFKWRLATGVLLLGSFALGIWIGTVKAVAIAYAFTNGVLLPYPLFTVAGRLIDLSFSEVVRSIIGVLGCAILMAIILWALRLLIPQNWAHWIYLVIQIPLGVVIYGILLQTFRVNAYYEARTLLLEQIRDWRTIRIGVN